MLINRPAFLAGVQVGAAARAETKDMKEQDWVNQFNGVQRPVSLVLFPRLIAMYMRP